MAEDTNTTAPGISVRELVETLRAPDLATGRGFALGRTEAEAVLAGVLASPRPDHAADVAELMQHLEEGLAFAAGEKRVMVDAEHVRQLIGEIRRLSVAPAETSTAAPH